MHAEHVGRVETRSDQVWPNLLRDRAATRGVATPVGLPLLWHWTLFQDWVTPDAIGPDGHPRRGGFLPPLQDLPRRMWAGGRVRVRDTLGAGEAVERVSTVLAVRETRGTAGQLVFVTVRHAISGPRGPAIEEEQDLVYRSIEGAAVKPADPAAELPAGALSRTVLPDPVLLFRYSALTGNGHRIHYDADYVRSVEGYPGLVVHGPLQATWMAALAEEGWGGIAAFRFRGHRPAFAGQALRVEGWREGGTVTLRTLDATGAVCMSGEAELA